MWRIMCGLFTDSRYPCKQDMYGLYVAGRGLGMRLVCMLFSTSSWELPPQCPTFPQVIRLHQISGLYPQMRSERTVLNSKGQLHLLCMCAACITCISLAWSIVVHLPGNTYSNDFIHRLVGVSAPWRSTQFECLLLSLVCVLVMPFLFRIFGYNWGEPEQAPHYRVEQWIFHIYYLSYVFCMSLWTVI